MSDTWAAAATRASAKRRVHSAARAVTAAAPVATWKGMAQRACKSPASMRGAPDWASTRLRPAMRNTTTPAANARARKSSRSGLAGTSSVSVVVGSDIGSRPVSSRTVTTTIRFVPDMAA